MPPEIKLQGFVILVLLGFASGLKQHSDRCFDLVSKQIIKVEQCKELP